MTRIPKRKHVAAFLLGFAWCTAAGNQTALAGELIRVNGSGAALDMMTLLNDAYQKLHPEIRIEMLKPLGSSGAIKALLAGALDLAVSSKTAAARAGGAGRAEPGVRRDPARDRDRAERAQDRHHDRGARGDL